MLLTKLCITAGYRLCLLLTDNATDAFLVSGMIAQALCPERQSII